jgi:hypothetical protein
MSLITSNVSQVAGGVNSLVTYEAMFTGAAPGASGAVLSVVGGLAVASDKVWLSVGGSAAATSAVMTAAVANAMVATPTITDTNQVVIGSLAATQASKTNAATGLVNYFSAAASAADLAKAVNFCAKIEADRIVGVELVLLKGAASGASAGDATAQNLINYASPVVIPEPVTLGANSRMIKTGSTQVALGTDLLVYVPGEGIVYGTLTIGSIDNFAVEVGDVVVLRLKCLV